MTNAQILIGLIGALLGVAVSALALWANVRPSLRRNSAVADAILGEEAVVDRSGQMIQPARPGLVHRVGTVEEAVLEFRRALTAYTELRGLYDSLERRVAVVENTHVKDIIVAAERAATAAASAELLRMAGNRDVLDTESEETR